MWIQLPDGRNIRRHIDHIRSRQSARENQNTENNQLENSETNCYHRVVDETNQEEAPISIPDVNATSEIEPVSPTIQPTTNTGVVQRIVEPSSYTNTGSTHTLRRSDRVIRRPVRYNN